MQARDFFDEYVRPAAELWIKNQSAKHLAIHAICQIDILAEVVANSPGEKPKTFRDHVELGFRFSQKFGMRTTVINMAI